LKEPYLSLFKELILSGACAQDIHDAPVTAGFASGPPAVSEAFVEREVERTAMHQRSLCPILELHIGPCDSILDVGCSSGGTTVALALSPVLRPERVIGVDPNGASIRAAEMRALGSDVSPAICTFEEIESGRPLPFADCEFDLVACVSVLEFITQPDHRLLFIQELKRVTRCGGYVFLSTPTSLRVREHHSRRIMGNLIRRVGYPWSTSPWQLKKLFSEWEVIDLSQNELERILRKLKLPPVKLPRPVGTIISWGYTWQKVLARKSTEAIMSCTLTLSLWPSSL